MIPNPGNACAGRYKDWLEVNLLEACNARCPWCVERAGWKPGSAASTGEMILAMLSHPAGNIMLLGGEPTLHPEIGDIVREVSSAGKSVYMTTNGSMLSREFARRNLGRLAGVNVSVHSPNLRDNERITGILLDRERLSGTFAELAGEGVRVRMNCNVMRGHVEDESLATAYVWWSRGIGAAEVRFSELKADAENFVDLRNFFRDARDIKDPFTDGCAIDIRVAGMPVNLRFMCGIQTPHRPAVACPEQVPGEVLYYDGYLYRGWQLKGDMPMLSKKGIEKLLESVKDGTVSVEEAAEKLKAAQDEKLAEGRAEGRAESSDHCRY